MLPRRMRFPAVCTLMALSLAGVPALGEALTLYQAPGGAFAVGYPTGWTVVAAGNGRVVAFVGPALVLRGAPFRPNFVVSLLAAPRGTTDAQAAQVADGALARAFADLVRLGQERASAQDGKPVVVTYYTTGGAPTGLYLVAGVAQRSALLYVFLGTTSPELSAYWAHAKLYRDAILAFRFLK